MKVICTLLSNGSKMKDLSIAILLSIMKDVKLDIKNY